MNEIKCPHCGEVFKVDASGYAEIVKQVRNAEFSRDLDERVKAVQREGEQALELERSRSTAALQRQSLSATLNLPSRRTLQLNSWHKRLPSAMPSFPSCAPSSRALPQSARAQASARRLRPVPTLKGERRAPARNRQLACAAGRKDDEVKLAESAARNAAQNDVAARDAQIAELQAKLAAADKAQEMALAAAAAESQRELDATRSEAERTLTDYRAKVQEKFSAAKVQSEQEAEGLRAQLREQELRAKMNLSEAVAAVERERDEARAKLTSELAVRDSREEQAKAAHELELAQAKRASDDLIRYKDEEIERLKDMKVRLSTKMVGESLEQHCETEFNRLRMTAFPNAYFEKDNDASEGTKGDFIFRECDASGNEIISIMFEMKNENDETATKHKNEDFFKKLDHDRRQKGCEYAVLCTLLEPESELYNAGIVDVSYRYEKMYVIRPQFFIPMITLLRNAAMGSLRYKQELAEYKQQNIDVTNFEAKMEKFKDGFSRNYNLASKQFESAIKEIDAAIKQLEKTKDDLRRSTENLRLAHNKADELTIRKLTWSNKTMKAAFDEARETASETGDEPAEADSYEVEDAE